MLEALPWVGPVILVVFALAYTLVFFEEKLHLRKSKPVIVAAGLIWILVGIGLGAEDRAHDVAEQLHHVLLEFAQLFLFLLSAMSFVATMVERNVFEHLRTRLLAAHLSVRAIFWVTGLCAFFISPIADNLTTALVMGTVVISAIGRRKKIAASALVNVVVAANAGGAFSPFGDITTLMVWQKGMVEFSQFFSLFIPALINWLVPAFIISLTLPSRRSKSSIAIAPIREGGIVVVSLFLATIVMTVSLDHTLHLPPFLGMMLGLGFLKSYGYFLRRRELREEQWYLLSIQDREIPVTPRKPFDIFHVLEKTEWDTLLFFYGVMLCVGGLNAVGYLSSLSQVLYTDLGPTTANIAIGVLSAIIDNIPLTFAVLTMNPTMDIGQWLLITLTAGVGGSLLSIGSAAGVALMGIGKESYTFMSHLRWTWAIALGFAASIGAHLLINHGLFAP